MIGLLCFTLAVVASLFKPKIRLAAENAVLRHQLVVLRRKVSGPSPGYEQRPLVLRPTVSLVPVDPGGPHDHPPRDRRALASGWLSQLLALEVPISRRATTDRDEPTRVDPADE